MLIGRVFVLRIEHIRRARLPHLQNEKCFLKREYQITSLKAYYIFERITGVLRMLRFFPLFSFSYVVVLQRQPAGDLDMEFETGNIFQECFIQGRQQLHCLLKTMLNLVLARKKWLKGNLLVTSYSILLDL